MPDSTATPLPLQAQEETSHKGSGNPPFGHALLFTGHMIDRSDREHPRFPASAESRVREAMREAIERIPWTTPGTTIGLAGGASGGDILFHEICAELAIPARIMLALPADEFVAASVAPAGPAWIERFRALLQRTGPEGIRIMGEHDGLSEGLTSNVWQRANLWMMDAAIALAREQALLALWDGHIGDGPGGTEHFIEVAQRLGIRILPTLVMRSLLPAQQSQK